MRKYCIHITEYYFFEAGRVHKTSRPVLLTQKEAIRELQKAKRYMSEKGGVYKSLEARIRKIISSVPLIFASNSINLQGELNLSNQKKIILNVIQFNKYYLSLWN